MWEWIGIIALILLILIIAIVEFLVKNPMIAAVIFIPLGVLLVPFLIAKIVSTIRECWLNRGRGYEPYEPDTCDGFDDLADSDSHSCCDPGHCDHGGK